MQIENTRTVKVDELAQFIPTNAGATFSSLWQIFYYTRMFKYISYRHFTQLKKHYNKICTYDKLYTLCELGYLRSPQRAVYCATNKVLPILKEAGFNIDILPLESTGYGDINELNNTDVFVQATKLKHFHSLLYPHFKNLIPDALLVRLDEENRKYKLTFLEIEAQKPKWNKYVEAKKEKYVQLSKSLDFYNWWKDVAPKMDLPTPPEEKFSFNVIFICSLKKEFGNGFKVVSQISDADTME
jgi:hypothetical protein